MKIKCLLVMPGKEVQRVRIPANIKFIKALIGENLLNIRANENNIIIANQNARNDEFNRFFQGNILYGTFIVVSLKKNRRTSMKKKDIRKFSNMFKLSKHQKKIERFKEEFLEEYYTNIRKSVKGADITSKVSDTLLTKVLMGTLGCVPAYDRYFINGIKVTKVSTGNYNKESLIKLANFYVENSDRLEAARQNFKVGALSYPQMKLLDMGFWQIGLENDNRDTE